MGREFIIPLIPIKIIGIKVVGNVFVCTEMGEAMKISTKGRYGLRAVIDIAIHGENEPVSLSDIAVRQNISMSYLEQLVAKLKKADIVTSVRGARGGYSLAAPPDKISAGDILRALEGDLSPVHCSEVTENGAPCSESGQCISKVVWKRIGDSINHAVDNLMLSDLLADTDENKNSGC